MGYPFLANLFTMTEREIERAIERENSQKWRESLFKNTPSVAIFGPQERGSLLSFHS